MHHSEPRTLGRWTGLAGAFILVILCIMALTSLASQASAVPPGEQGGAERSGLFLSTLEIHANYAWDWVAGLTDPGATVWVTLTNSVGTVKEEALISADGATGDFFTSCEDWFSGSCPDILPGDQIFVWASGLEAKISPIGALLVDILDEIENTVSGTLEASWLTGPVNVRCEVWEDPGSAPIYLQVDPVGGTFLCDFDDVGWDLQWGDALALSYFEPDADQVTTIATWPWMRVNAGDEWVGGDFPAGHTVWITVTDDMGSEKANATTSSDYSGGWGAEGFETREEHWSPGPPDIQPGDRVEMMADNGYTHTLEVGVISARVDSASDTISGTIVAPFAVSLPVDCQPWGAWEQGIGDAPIKQSSAEPDGSAPFLCRWDPATEWDVQPGQRIAVLYREPDDHDGILDLFEEQAPHLRIDKWASGAPAEDANFRFHIEVSNDGSGPAENVTITDTMQGGLSFLEDTSGIPHGGSGPGPIVWEAGTLDPGQGFRFDVFVQITAAASDTITNTVYVGTSTPTDQGDPSEKYRAWTAEVRRGDTYLSVGKSTRTDDPAPDQDVIFALDVCNQGNTGSSQITLTDRLHQALSHVNWWADVAGWSESHSDAGELVLALPSLDAQSCSEVNLRAHVAAGTQPGDPLTNTVSIAADNDLSAGDDEATWEGQVGETRLNLRIEKDWNGGQLVPGGRIRYNINYQNDGNLPAGGFQIDDTFPVSTTFAGAWYHDPWGGHEFPPAYIDDHRAVWEIGGLDNGISGDFEIALDIDPDALPGTLLENTVFLSPLPGEERTDDNLSRWLERLMPEMPNLRVRKWHNWNGDGQLNYQVQFENIGSEPVSDVWITDVLPLDTHWDGWWDLSFEEGRLATWDYVNGSRTFLWNLSELNPGESGWIRFNANLDYPGTPLRWYTNTVEISIPPGDPSPDDNYHETVAFSGGEVRRVEFWLNKTGPSSMWGEAVPDSPITVTTPAGQVYAWADPGCGGCWDIGDAGMLAPGDAVEVMAGDGLLPVEITIPNPLTAQADSVADEVSGQIGGWSERPVEIHVYWPDGYREVLSDVGGNYLASFPGIPPGGSGYVRIVDEISFAQVIFHRPFWTLDLTLDVNYGHDWVEGPYEPGHTVWITVTESDGSTVKGLAELHTGDLPGWDRTGFSTSVHGWLTVQPDLQPGDWVYGRVDNGRTATIQIGEVTFTPDFATDTVAGVVDASGLTAPLPLRCEIWDVPNAPGVDTWAESNPGPFLCDFQPEGWDLAPGQTMAVMYWDPEGDRVINTFDWPHIAADIGPGSGGNRHVWGNHAAPNAAITISVTDSLDNPVADAVVTSDERGNYDSGESLPEGSLLFWHVVQVDFGNGFTDTLTVFPLGGEADPDTDVVTVTAGGPPFFSVNLEFCQPEGCDQIDMGGIGLSGIVTANLMAERGFDVRPGTWYHAHLSVWNGQELIYSWPAIPTDLWIGKQLTPGHAVPGGIYLYQIQYGNYGPGSSDGTVITDTLPANTTYAADTSGLPVDVAGGVITWTLDTLPPGNEGQFFVALNIDDGLLPGTSIEQNCVTISAASPEDSTPDNNSLCSSPVPVEMGGHGIWVDKWPWFPDPHPGQLLIYEIQYGSEGGGATGPVWLTDTLPSGTSYVGWQEENGWGTLWTEVITTGGQLVLHAPAGIPGDMGGHIRLALRLDPGVEISTTLENLIEVVTPDDVNPENNWDVDDQAHVSPPRVDLALRKEATGGILVPGGEVRYHLAFQNQGNLATSAWISDTLPPGTSYQHGSAWVFGQGDPFPLEPVEVTADHIIWNVGVIEVGQGLALDFALNIEAEPPSDSLENCATIEPDGSAGPDGIETTPGDNTACAVETLHPSGPNLRVRKWHNWNDDGQLGYQIEVENVGDEPVPQVTITDTYPSGTTFHDEWGHNFWEQPVTLAHNAANRELVWELTRLEPGWRTGLWFNTDLVSPGELVRWYTNTIEIGPVAGDVNPDDNVAEDVAFSGSEVRRVELWLEPDGRTHMWGDALPGTTLTVTTAYSEIVTTVGQPECDSCWNIEYAGTLSPGDWVTVAADQGRLPVELTVPDPFSAELDPDNDSVRGQIGGWFYQPVEVYGNWPDGHRNMESNGSGEYEAFYDRVPRAGDGYVRFETEVDYAQVVFHRSFRSPELVLTVDYRDDYVGGQYEGGHTMVITVTDPYGEPKARAEMQTPPEGGWWNTNWDNWSPAQPDIEPDDRVYGRVDDGAYTTEVRVGTVGAHADVDTDVVQASIKASWIDEPVIAGCEIHEEGAPGGITFSDVNPDGGTFECDFSGIWDIVPGQNIAVYYLEPDDDRVQTHADNPAPYLRLEKWADGEPAVGGNFAFHIRYLNQGGLPAENTFITDTLEGMTYLGDTSDLPTSVHGPDSIVWDVGTLWASDWIQFDVFVQVAALASDTITNTASITTSNPYDQGEPWEKVSQWSGHVVGNQTSLNIGKGAWTGDPAPDTDVVFEVNPCNNGPTASSQVTLTDTLHPSMTLQTWWSNQPGWSEVSSDTHQIVVSRWSLPGWSCDSIYLRVHLDRAAEPGLYLTNTATLFAANDLSTGDDVASWDGWVREPYRNLYINKNWNSGRLVPGGQVSYDISFGNSGNLPIGETLRVTDTLPVHTSFVSAWLHDGLHMTFPIEPILVTSEYVVWEVPRIDNGYRAGFGVLLDVDPSAPLEVLTNTVQITCLPDEDCGDNKAEWIERLYRPGPNLRVRKWGSWDDWGSDTRRASYGIRIENVGDARVENVFVQDWYPPNMQLDSGIDTEWWREPAWGDDPTDHTFTVTYPYLAPGESTWIDFGAIVPGEGPIDFGLVLTNTVGAAGVPGEPDYEDNVDHAVLTTGPDLFVKKKLVSGELAPGALVTYSLTFGNNRPGNEWWWNQAGNATLTDTLPVKTEFDSARIRWCGETEWCDFSPISTEGQEVAWQLGQLRSGDWNEIYLTVRVSDTIEAADVLTNWVEIASDRPAVDVEPYWDNNQDWLETLAVLPRFEASKAFESSLVAGTEVTYTLTVTNTGNAPGTTVVLADALPAGINYGGSDGTLSGDVVGWDLALLAPEGGWAEGWFSGTLTCEAGVSIVNDDYRVIYSDQGVTSASGDPVSLGTLSPTISVVLDSGPSYVVVGDTVFLTATADTDGTALTYEWDLGDGRTGTGLAMRHVYTVDGSYTVTLTATDACGYTGVASITVDVNPPDLIASFDQSATEVVINSGVTFTDTSTTDGPPIVEWRWDFGDGSPPATTQNTSHTYLGEGTFAVSLVVTDALGYSDYAQGAVIVNPPQILVDFDYDPRPARIRLGHLMTFTDTSTTDGPNLVEWKWHFGDGTTSALQNPSQEYTAVGTYTVSLVVTDALGYTGQEVKTDLVVVLPPCTPLGSTDWTYEPPIPLINKPIEFTASYLPLDADTPITYEWDFGDGTTATETAPTAQHTYPTSGSKIVKLTVYNPCTPAGVSRQKNLFVEARHIYLPLVIRNY